MKLSVSAYRAHASAHKKILTSSYQHHYGSTSTPPVYNPFPNFKVDEPSMSGVAGSNTCAGADGESAVLSNATSREDDDDSSNNASSEGKSPGQRFMNKLSPFPSKPVEDVQLKTSGLDQTLNGSRTSLVDLSDKEDSSNDGKRGQKWRNVQAVMAYYNALRKIKRTKSNQRWMKLRTTVQISSAMQTKKPPLKREDSFLKRFSTRQIPETQETVEDTGSEGATGEAPPSSRRRRRIPRAPRTVVNPDENFYFYWLWVITTCVLYNLWTLIVRQSFPELQMLCDKFWFTCDCLTDAVFVMDLAVQLRTGYLEQGLMVYDARKLAKHYLSSRAFLLDVSSLTPLDLLQLQLGINPMLRFPRFLKVYRAVHCYYMVESRTVYPNFWRVINLIHILLILAHWFGCFYFLLSEAEGFQGDWVYPYRPGDYATLTRKYLGSLYWSTLTLTTIGDLPTPETNADNPHATDGPKFLPRRGLKSRLLQFKSNKGYVFTIVSYLIGVFIFATIVGQVGNVITNRNANRLEFERLLDGAKTYMRHHKVPGGMKRRVLRWYDYSWSRGRIQGGGDINTALGLLPDKLKTELALHVNLSVLKKVTIFQECQPEFLHDLVLKMKAYIFTPGDSICRKGEVAREMFIIADGILEVISETGRVLTTMKAGDFFGEIGILNLDGLNKRTADVRSVGYSELFSLSREDVLAAMKDYPEAQEILQTLGRKRLQEARNCSRVKVKKKESDENADKLGDDSASKRIVHKLRSDVKGIRNAIRCRSRTSRSGRAAGAEVLVPGADEPCQPPPQKGLLRRLPRVHSDDFNVVAAAPHHEDTVRATMMDATSGSKDGEKSISPIGAGLPLLARLKLLKERQDREEKAVKLRIAGSALISPQTLVQHVTSPGITSEEPEVIGAGLPLLQRLLLLKAKEDRLKNQLTLANSNPPSSSETISPSSLKSPLSPTIKTLSPIRKDSESYSPGKLHSPTMKSSRKNSSGSSDGTSRPKVSFKDNILQVQSDGTSVCQPLSKDTSETMVSTSDKESLLKSDFNQISQNKVISIPNSVVNKIKSPVRAIGSTFRDKLKLIQGGGAAKEITPVINNAPISDKTSQPIENKNSSFTETIPSVKVEAVREHTKSKKVQPWSKLKKASILIESQDEKSIVERPLPPPKHESVLEKETHGRVNKNDKMFPDKQEDKIVKKEVVPAENNNLKVENKNIELDKNNKTNLINFKEIRPRNEVRTQHRHKHNIRVSPEKSKPKEILPPEKVEELKSTTSVVKDMSKNYASIDDLSPEYGPLPFVKKLKILNERQKLAELERVIKIRSSSLDCASSSEDMLSDNLIRCHSEGSTMDRRATHKLLHDTIHGQESNETLERQTLKSILKKLSEDVTPAASPNRNSKEFRKLIRAPTLEGYAARHSKFSKSVTFNRHTLPSPPSSTNEENTNVSPFSVDADFFSAPSEDFDSPQIQPVQMMTIEVGIESEPESMLLISSPPLSDDLMNECGDKTHFDHEFNNEYEYETHLDPIYEINSKEKIISLRPEDIRVPTEKPKLTLISAVANQKKLLRGSLEDHEYFGEVLFGIKNVIQGHLHEVQGKFQDRFNSLELEVRRRDEIISQLQNRIQELERLGLSALSAGTLQPNVLSDLGPEDERFNVSTFNTEEAETSFAMNASSGSDELSVREQGFMRGDSLDTVFAPSPPTFDFNDESYQLNRVMSTHSDSSKSQSDSSRHPSEGNNDSDEIQKITQLAEGIQLERLSYSELQQLADTLSKQEERKKARARNLGLNLTSNDRETYSRKKAAKLKQRASWKDQSNDDSLELNEFSRSISPPTLSEDSSLLTSQPRAPPPRRPLRALGAQLGAQLGLGSPRPWSTRSARATIKKTMSVDAGMHRTAGGNKRDRLQREGSQRKFSLGSWFGHTSRTPATTSRVVSSPQDVVLDIGSDSSWSDGGSSTSVSSDADSVPKTPIFEDFVGSRYRPSNRRRASGSLASPSSPALGGDWELLMLADELDRREREKEDKLERDNARRDRDNQIREELAWRSGTENYERILKDLEEESDTPPTPQNANADCVMETVTLREPHLPSTSAAPQHPTTNQSQEIPTTQINSIRKKTEGKCASGNQPKKRSSSLILRASSLESQDESSGVGGRKFGSLKGSSSEGHKRL